MRWMTCSIQDVAVGHIDLLARRHYCPLVVVNTATDLGRWMEYGSHTFYYVSGW
jgi:hypothetical protein